MCLIKLVICQIFILVLSPHFLPYRHLQTKNSFVALLMMLLMCEFQVYSQSSVISKCSSLLTILTGMLFLVSGIKLVLGLLVNSTRFSLDVLMVSPAAMHYSTMKCSTSCNRSNMILSNFTLTNTNKSLANTSGAIEGEIKLLLASILFLL